MQNAVLTLYESLDGTQQEYVVLGPYEHNENIINIIHADLVPDGENHTQIIWNFPSDGTLNRLLTLVD